LLQWMTSLKVLHCSDLHFGFWAIPEQYEALEQLIEQGKFDVVAVSGDLSQRARAGEFQRARSFLRHAARVSRTIVVPGNHDIAWWTSPLKLGDATKLFAMYKMFVSEDLEPMLRVPGATFVGLNTCHGVIRETLTWNVRDVSILGHLDESQIDRAAERFRDAPPGDARIVVMHHNPMKGELSQRFGLKNTDRVLARFAAMDVDLILCGHDHQEAFHHVEVPKRGLVVSTAGATSTHMARGGRPSSVNSIEITGAHIEVRSHLWVADRLEFEAGPVKRLPRAGAAAV
jgi:3',5'-cyclic AMP phosphodiesterase CpdA